MSSEWIGKIGEHIELDVVIKGCIYRNVWGNNMRLHWTTDKHENIITFRSTAGFGLNSKWRISGMIKNHNTWHGQKQTHLSNWGLMFPPNGDKK